MRRKAFYTLRCKQCWTNTGYSRHNFADKLLFCSEACMLKFEKEKEEMWRDKNEENKNKTSKGKTKGV